VFVGCRFCHPRSELQQADILFSPDTLLQNISTFSVGYVRTSGAATKHCKYLQQGLNFKQTSQARGLHKLEMRQPFSQENT